MRMTNGPRSGSKFKHSAEKAPKAPDKYRDDYYKKKKKLADAKLRDADKVPTNQSRRPKGEIRTASDVRKQRAMKLKRKEKNARPSRKGKR